MLIGVGVNFTFIHPPTPSSFVLLTQRKPILGPRITLAYAINIKRDEANVNFTPTPFIFVRDT